jgi:hypothetical protein
MMPTACSKEAIGQCSSSNNNGPLMLLRAASHIDVICHPWAHTAGNGRPIRSVGNNKSDAAAGSQQITAAAQTSSHQQMNSFFDRGDRQGLRACLNANASPLSVSSNTPSCAFSWLIRNQLHTNLSARAYHIIMLHNGM